MPLYIKKNPNTHTLISKVYADNQPDGYVLSIEQEVSDWVHEQILAGWEPTFPDLPIAEQKEIVEQQRNTYREQSLFLKSQVDAATTEKQELTEQLAAATATIATLRQRIASLEAIRAFNPRWTTPDYFINRFTAKEAKEFYSSEDPLIVGGQQLLEAYEAAGYHVDLDDTQVQGLTGYMVQLGMITPERRVQVLRDATAAEAWYPAC